MSEHGKCILVQLINRCVKHKEKQVQSPIFSHVIKLGKHHSHYGSILQWLQEDEECYPLKKIPSQHCKFLLH